MGTLQHKCIKPLVCSVSLNVTRAKSKGDLILSVRLAKETDANGTTSHYRNELLENVVMWSLEITQGSGYRNIPHNVQAKILIPTTK
jgi:hypothetical protein